MYFVDLDGMTNDLGANFKVPHMVQNFFPIRQKNCAKKINGLFHFSGTLFTPAILDKKNRSVYWVMLTKEDKKESCGIRESCILMKVCC